MVKLFKKSSQDSYDPSLHMKIRQYLVIGRRYPKNQGDNPPAYSLRIFAKNHVLAKSKYWQNNINRHTMRKQQKFKKAQGQIISINQIFEKNPNAVKTYGVLFKYQSRTTIHNMYKQFRDTTLNGAISQLHMQMSGNHRANHDTIHIISTHVVRGKRIRRVKSKQFMDSNIRFPIIKTIGRNSKRGHRRVFARNRPNTYKCG